MPEDQGWIIHRIWSTDWYQRPEDQLQRAIEAIEKAKTRLAARDENDLSPHRAVPIDFSTFQRDSPVETIQEVNLYREASLMVPIDTEPHLVPLNQMVELVVQVVEVESPVHEDEVVTRIRTSWKLGRAGGRIQNAVKAALQAANRQGRIVGNVGFYVIPEKKVTVRDRSSVLSIGLKKPEYLPAVEVAAAIVEILREHLGSTRAELPMHVGRLLGFRSTSAGLRSLVNQVVTDLRERKEIEEHADMLIVQESKPLDS